MKIWNDRIDRVTARCQFERSRERGMVSSNSELFREHIENSFYACPDFSIRCATRSDHRTGQFE